VGVPVVQGLCGGGFVMDLFGGVWRGDGCEIAAAVVLVLERPGFGLGGGGGDSVAAVVTRLVVLVVMQWCCCFSVAWWGCGGGCCDAW
jgi:hypothetical protein